VRDFKRLPRVASLPQLDRVSAIPASQVTVRPGHVSLATLPAIAKDDGTGVVGASPGGFGILRRAGRR